MNHAILSSSASSVQHGCVRRAAWLLLALLCGSGVQAQTNETKPKPALTVGVASVERRPMQRLVVGTGSIVPWEQLIVAAESSGLKILAVLVEEGERVAAGQVLARLDDGILQAQLKANEASIAEAQANLAVAQADLKRAEDLMGGRNIAEQAFQQRQATARGATARVTLAEAQRDEIKRRLEQTAIRAPSAGIVIKRAALIGSVVNPTTELFRIIRDGRLELDAQLPELDLDAVKPGQRARVVRGANTHGGTVRLVAPLVDSSTRLGIVHIALEPDATLRPGMFARAEIEVGEAANVAVPDASLVFRDGRPGIFSLDSENRVALRTVATGVRKEGWVEITAGLDPGQRIVVVGAGFLNDGDLVRIGTATRERGIAK